MGLNCIAGLIREDVSVQETMSLLFPNVLCLLILKEQLAPRPRFN